MEKRYRSEAREVKKIALAARLTFRQRKLFLDIQPYLTALFFMIMCGVIVSVEINTTYPIFAWFVLCIMSIPMYIIMLFLFHCLPKFKTLDEYIEYSLKKHLKEHSWRHISMLLKNHKFPKIIEDILLKILMTKINKMARRQEIIEILKKYEYLVYIEEENSFKIKEQG